MDFTTENTEDTEIRHKRLANPIDGNLRLLWMAVMTGRGFLGVLGVLGVLGGEIDAAHLLCELNHVQ
jgi:hypothetical protein